MSLLAPQLTGALGEAMMDRHAPKYLLVLIDDWRCGVQEEPLQAGSHRISPKLPEVLVRGATIAVELHRRLPRWRGAHAQRNIERGPVTSESAEVSE